MAHFARENERVATQKLNEVIENISRITVQYDDVLPFMKVKDMDDDSGLTGHMEKLAKELLTLARVNDEPGMDSVD